MQFDMHQFTWQAWTFLGLSGLAVAWIIWRIVRSKAVVPARSPSHQPLEPSRDQNPRTASDGNAPRGAEVVAMFKAHTYEDRKDALDRKGDAERASDAQTFDAALASGASPSSSQSLEAISVRCERLMARAQNELKSSSPAAAASALREVIVLASEAGLAEQHAAARIELGELARLEGDLITACEHWQIARGLFHDLKNKPRSTAVETRMREHGCPTDWVLNDF